MNSSATVDLSLDATASVEPVLPPELERKIFEFGALEHCGSAPTFALVAKRVKDWVEPILYSTIVVSSVADYLKPPLIHRERSKYLKAPHFEKATRYAQNVLLHHYDERLLFEVIRNCHKVENLALWGLGTRSYAHYARIITILPLKILSVDVGRLLRTEDGLFRFCAASFMNLTHLDIINLHDCRNIEDWEEISQLPRLTHLALDFPDAEFIKMVLEDCKVLHILVLFLAQDEEAYQGLDEIRSDVRVIKLSGLLSSTDIWIRGASGGEDFWDKAEVIYSRRILHKGTSCF
ncbi:hypothetical protein CVT26_000743 [Gymnopilus dilepis]|uniref:F-box domain-containing protein n=1 Tax=Gymnopilus dilepis TaxID=231916 RepID=A0A409Y2L2_9AGAR|nr:hypothetical protein CVT26_000743 [Gymnopilus dilepis]